AWKEVDVDGRRASEITRLPAGLLPIERCQPRRLPLAWALAVGTAWPLLFLVMVAITPAPADPNAVPTPVDALVSLAVMTGLLGPGIAGAVRRPEALIWSTCLGVIWVATTIACPLTGHHDAVGWPWRFELTASGSLLLLSLVGVRVLRAR